MLRRVLHNPFPLLSLLLTICSGAAIAADSIIEDVPERPRIALIIDDLGYALTAGRRAIALPGPVAYAVLRDARRARVLGEHAAKQGKEVLLPLPLQAQNLQGRADPGALHLDMSRGQFAAAFAANLAAVPHVIGVNNHRGSLLTRHPGHMQWLMEEIRARNGLFFVDSYTTANSVAMQMAAEAGVNAIRRDVFLDPDKSPQTVARQFERMKRLAHKRGFVVAIGHPYAATLDLLENELPKLAEQGIELVTISELVR